MLLAISTLATDQALAKRSSSWPVKDGYFIRGALVKGKLLHDDAMVFGEALVQAYEFEKSVARYPRVMITRDLMADIDQFCKGFGAIGGTSSCDT